MGGIFSSLLIVAKFIYINKSDRLLFLLWWLMTLQKDPLSWRPQYGEDADEDVLAQARRPSTTQSRTWDAAKWELKQAGHTSPPHVLIPWGHAKNPPSSLGRR